MDWSMALTHDDVLGFLTLSDAVKLRLVNADALRKCTTMNWNDNITPVKDLVKWKKYFPNSIALYFCPTEFRHERLDMVSYVTANPIVRDIFCDMRIETLILPIAKKNHFKDLWPLNTGQFKHLRQLTICVDSHVINCLPLLESLQVFCCGEGSKINDADFLLSRGKFWQLVPALKEFDCTHTNLSFAILEGFDGYPKELHLIHTHQRFFNEKNATIKQDRFKILINRR